MKRKSIIEALIVAAALLGMYGCAVGSVDREFGKNSVSTAAADLVEQRTGDVQQGMEEEVIDYTDKVNPTVKAEEGEGTQYITEALSEENWEDSYEQDFYERHKDMDYDGDGEIAWYESARWDFIHTDLEAEIEDMKTSGQQMLHLGRYVSAYMEIMGLDQSESVPLMEQADQLDAVYAQMCSDRGMTMDELEEIYETDLRGRIQEIRESDPHYKSASDEKLEDGPPSYSDEPQDPSKKIDLDSLGN